MKIKDGFMLRKIAGDFIIVPVGESTREFNGIITVNESGKFLWEKLQEEVSEEDLLEFMLDKYDVREDIAREDIAEFINIMKNKNILEQQI